MPFEIGDDAGGGAGPGGVVPVTTVNVGGQTVKVSSVADAVGQATGTPIVDGVTAATLAGLTAPAGTRIILRTQPNVLWHFCPDNIWRGVNLNLVAG